MRQALAKGIGHDRLADELVGALGLPRSLVRTGLHAAAAVGMSSEAEAILADLGPERGSESVRSWLAAWSQAERRDPEAFRAYRAFRRHTRS